MFALSRTSLIVAAAVTALGLGCSRSQTAPQPVASSATIGPTSPSEQRAANNQPGAAASNESLNQTSGRALDTTGLPLPPGSTMVSSGAVDDVHVFPARGQLGQHQRVVAGGVGAGAIDHVYESPLSYEDAVNFYDRALQPGKELPYGLDGGAARRMTNGDTTAWAFVDDKGNDERVEVSGTTPTRISIAEGTAAAAVETEPAGRANAQPGTGLARPGTERWDGGRRPTSGRDAGRSGSPSSGSGNQ